MVSITVDDNILLRSYEVADAQELFDVVNASRRHLNPWLNWVSETTKPEHSLEYIQAAQHELHIQKSLGLGIFYDDKLVGGIGMHTWEKETKRAEIGYWLSAEQEGKGTISRSMVNLIDYLFDNIGLNKIELHFVQANKRSARVAARLGFKVEGVIRQGVLRHGMTEDLVITGLLKKEWKNNQQ